MKISTLALALSLCVGTALTVGEAFGQEKKPAETQVQAGSLKVGDPAPKIEVAKWVKGTPVEKLDPKQVYVVEFWATWCGPCIRGIPHLTELQEQYGDKVKIIGVSIWEESRAEEGADLEAKVTSFVKEMGDTMGYTVAFGGRDAKMAKTWMEAANIQGIPAAFIVKNNTIQWIGLPARMDRALADIVAGTYDPKTAGEKQREFDKKGREIQNKLGAAMQSDNKEEALKQLDALVEHDPSMAGPVAPLRFKLLMDTKGPEAAYAYAREQANKDAKRDAEILNAISWAILDDEEITTKNYDVALLLAQRADELTKHKNPAILDTLARAHFEKGDVDLAIKTQEKAIEMLTDRDQRIRGELEENLRKYRAAKKG